jgi:protein-disulfide isomerase
MVENEKRDEDLLEEDEDLEESSSDEIIEEIQDEPVTENSGDVGKVAEDAVTDEDTVTGYDSDANTENEVEEEEETHDHAPLPVENKPSPVAHMGSDDRMGTGAHYESDDHISMDKDVFWKYVKIVVVIAVLILGYNYFNDRSVTGNVIDNEPAGNQPPVVGQVGIGGNDIKGDPDAPITIIEFSDYECPFCARFYVQTLSLIDEEYIKTGKVNLVYRDFPLSIHPNAQKAAEAAECAGEQGKYYEMHDILFENGANGGVAGYKVYASQIGLNLAEFNECLDSGVMAAEVQKDFEEGQQYGVQGTPAFFINGKFISGAQPFSVFQQEIDALLAG